MNRKEIVKIAKRIGVPLTHVSNLENTDEWMLTHENSQCSGQYCTIHNRSNHSMRSFPQSFRYDRGIMERICTHGVGHPDPDDITDDTTHGCDSCCR